MPKGTGAVHIATQRRKYTGKDGVERVYESQLLRRSFREDGRVRNETLANLSVLPPEAIAAIRAILAGKSLVDPAAVRTITRSLPHGHLAAASVTAKALGLPGLLGPPCRHRQVALALIVARAVAPASKLATISWWADTTLGADLDVAAVSHRRGVRGDGLAADPPRRHREEAGGTPSGPGGQSVPDRDVRPVLLVGDRAALRPGRPRLLPRRQERLRADRVRAAHRPRRAPVAVRVFPGNTADPTAFTHAVTAVRDTFGLENMVMVGDRGMITSARITALKDLGGIGWLTALRAPQIAALAADDGPLQMSLFDEQNFAEITHPDYPGERLVACRNPLLAAERARKRGELLTATEAALAPIIAAVTAGRLAGAGPIGVKVGKVLGKFKMAKHFHLDITDTTLTISRDTDRIDTEAALDGIYVLRTTATPTELNTDAVIGAYKNLAQVERDFRSLKAIDLDLRPIHHRLDDRVKAHVLICMLAAYLTWHLRKALAPLTFTDEHPPGRDDPVAPARRSAAAATKAARKTTTDTALPARSYQALLTHLGTLTRNDLRYGDNGPIVPTLTAPTDTQRRAFDLLGAAIPLTLT